MVLQNESGRGSRSRGKYAVWEQWLAEVAELLRKRGVNDE